MLTPFSCYIYQQNSYSAEFFIPPPKRSYKQRRKQTIHVLTLARWRHASVIRCYHAMKILALLAQKGGAGKTTIGVHLAVHQDQQGASVLLIDVDPQRSSVNWWRSRKAPTPLMVATTAAKLPEVIGAASSENLDLVIIDTPPYSSTEAARAAELADLIVVPTRPAILDLRAIAKTVQLVNSAEHHGCLVLNACPPGRGGAEPSIVREARKGLASYGLPIAPVALAHRVAFSHALIDGRAVTEFEPKGKAAQEIRALSNWLEEKLNDDKKRKPGSLRKSKAGNRRAIARAG